MSWQNIPGWTDGHLEATYARAVSQASSHAPSCFLEVGTAFGRSAGLMATLIAESGKAIEMHCVDDWLIQEWKEPEMTERIKVAGGFFEAFSRCILEELTAEQRAHLRLHRKDSVAAAATFEDGSLDFCFIDGWHDEANVRRDLEAWLPKMKPDRMIAGHDYGGYPGVEIAVRAVLGARGIGFQVDGTCWWATT